MITTSTSTLHLNEKKQDKKGDQIPETDHPCNQTLDFILNYSKNLQIAKSRFISEIEVIKS